MAKTAKNTEKTSTEAPETTVKKPRAKKTVETPAPELKGVEVAPGTEIRVLSPEEYEKALQEKIAGEIKRYNIAEAGIEDLKQKYTGLAVPAITDKAGIKAVKEALSEVSSLITAIENKRIAIKADYLRTGKAIDAEAARLKGLLEPLKLDIKGVKDQIDAAEREEKERVEREAQEKLNSRVDQIKEAGMVFDGNFYSIGSSMSMDISTLKSLKDSEFVALVAKIQMEAYRLKKLKEEEEAAEAERRDKEREEREAFEKKQEEFRLQQEEFTRQQEAFAAQKREQEEAERKRQEQIEADRLQKEKEERERQEAIVKDMVDFRSGVLESLNFVYVTSTKQFVYSNEGGAYKIDVATLGTASTEYWNGLIKGAKEEIKNFDIKRDEIIAQRKKEEEERVAAAERERLEKERQEREAQEAEAARIEAERQAKLPEFEKVYTYVKTLRGVTAPEVEDAYLTAILEGVGLYLAELQSEIEDDLTKEEPTTAGE